MYERCIRLSDKCFNDYKVYKFGVNDIFMSGKVLCKLKESINFVAKTSDKIDVVVEPSCLTSNIKSGDLVAKLKIFNKNSLISEKNLYSIIDVEN